MDSRLLGWLLVYAVGGLMHPFVIGLFWVVSLKPRWPKLPALMPAVIFAAVAQGPLLLRSLLPQDNPLYTVMEAVVLLLVAGGIWLFFEESVWCKLLAICMTLILTMAAMMIALYFLHMMHMEIQPNFYSLDMFVMEFFTVGVSLLLFWVAGAAWRYVQKKEPMQSWNWLYVLFPLSQLMIVWELAHTILLMRVNLCLVLGILLGLAADLALFYIIYKHNRQRALEKYMNEMNTLWKVEEKSYRMQEEQRSRVEKIRHDLKNQVATVLYLLEQQQHAQARGLLEGVQGEIAKAENTVWCANPVVNAVLVEKAAQCKAQGIALDAELNLPQQLQIEPIFLCSSFSNLLDNAIHAAADCAQGKRKIKLRAALLGDYLHIKISNTARHVQREAPREGHGYGLLILSDIAQRHNGEFVTDWSGDRFTAMLTLEIPAEK